MRRRAFLKIAGSCGTGLLLPASSLLAHRHDNTARLFTAAAMPGSPVMALNQCGYLLQAAKLATVAGGEPSRPFQVLSEPHGNSIFEGRLSASFVDAASGDSVTLADFSSVTAPGKYRLATGGTQSEVFEIGANRYADALALSMRSFYGQRCGCAVDLGNGFRHSICHQKDAFHQSSGRSGDLKNLGGWHDAGDYGRYIVNSAITVGTLLWAWELYPSALRALPLRIPESGGKLPDFLAEVRWNLEWMLSLEDLDGGVWHKQTSEKFCGMIMPQNDMLTSYVIGTGTAPYKSTCATAGLAAVTAIAARCYAKYDASFAAICLAAAKRAWSWAVAHPNVLFANPPGIETGAYGDEHTEGHLMWASAELWRTTGDSQYEQAFLTAHPASDPKLPITAPSWSSVRSMACWAYALSQRKSDEPTSARVVEQTRAAAQTLMERHKSSGYGTTLDLTDYVWGSNGVAANHSLLLLLAHHLEPNPLFAEAAFGNLHYLLGRNCFAISWVTQAGTNSFLHPHHRPSIADGIPAPWPGLLSGGPNAHPADKVAGALPKLPPMRMWVDDALAYSVNEVAINWNAPLVFLLAAANR
jgi:endoglucanase